MRNYGACSDLMEHIIDFHLSTNKINVNRTSCQRIYDDRANIVLLGMWDSTGDGNLEKGVHF